MLPTKFQVNWPFPSREEAKNRFSTRPQAAILDFRSERIIFDLQVTPMLHTKFQVKWPFGSEDAKNTCSRWQPWLPAWSSDRNFLAIFDLQVTPIPSRKFQVNWPISSKEEAKNRFFRMVAMLAILDFRSE